MNAQTFKNLIVAVGTVACIVVWYAVGHAVRGLL
jgi:hypothetical protein